MNRKYGVIGWPIEHSLSPYIHLPAFNAIKSNATYELFSIHPDKLAENFKTFLRDKLAGWNITVPHKNAAVSLVDDIEETAKIAGSINTVVNLNGKLKGYSTDGFGLEMALKRNFKMDIQGKKILFIGAGGAVNACAVHLALLKPSKITFVNRTISKAENIASIIASIDKSINIEIFSPTACKQFKDIDIVIQGTSLGLKKTDPLPIDLTLFDTHTCFFDMIYIPTAFQKKAKELALPIADGREMLLYQGMKSFELWTGQNPPEKIMRTSLNSAIERTLCKTLS